VSDAGDATRRGDDHGDPVLEVRVRLEQALALLDRLGEILPTATQPDRRGAP